MTNQQKLHAQQERIASGGVWRDGIVFAIKNLLLGLLISIAQNSVAAAQSFPGEVKVGWFFYLTHLPVAVYVILFVIFILSLLNLWFQVRHGAGRIGSHSLWESLTDIWHGNVGWGLEQSGKRNARRYEPKARRQGSFRIGSEAVVVSDVVGAPRLSYSPRSIESHDRVPTPLDGVDHPLPSFLDSPLPSSAHKGESLSSPELEGTPVSFKFSSAVDIPAEEEMERRDKSLLTVSGFVTGPNGKALPSVLVYLTDLEGNRVGQSCRTSPETGEYKVLVNEPGKYVLRAHKRGMMMENVDGISLPMESGKIEGLNFSMIPDGCVVTGRLLFAGTSEPVPNTVIRCLSRLGDYTGETLSDHDGNFSIVGVPPNCECYLEILDASGKRIQLTDNFETVQKNQISLVIDIPKKTAEYLGSSDLPETVSSNSTKSEIINESSRS